MKKIIFIFITLFIFISNSNALSKFYLGEKVPNMHIETISQNGSHNGIPFILTREDGEFVYCLDQQQKINTTDSYNAYNYNDKIFKLSDNKLNKINLISYFGYGYENHTDIKWYGVTQFLIWKLLNYEDIYFTDTKDGDRIVAYETEIKEIEDLVEKYSKLPSFANNNIELSINSKNEIKDDNETINYYEIKEANIDAYIEDNKVHINTNVEGLYEITFIRKSPVKREYILYELENSQSLIYPGTINDIEFKINIEVTSGSITINKIDSEGINREFATLEGAEYGIYNNDELITTIKTDEDGKTFVDELPWGKIYYVKELKSSEGYNKDETVFEVSLSKDLKHIVIDSCVKVIEGNLIINKYYGELDNYKLEDGAIFDVYSINDNLKGSYESKEGIINTKLEYGEYYIAQQNGIPGYKYIKDFNVSIKEEKDYIFDLYDEKEILIVEVPDTKKYDYNKLISFGFILIGLMLIFKSTKKTTDL